MEVTEPLSRVRDQKRNHWSLPVTYNLSSGIPECRVKLRHSAPGRSSIMLMLVAALLDMFASKSHQKGHRAIEIKTSIASLVHDRGIAPFTYTVHALTAYADTMGGHQLYTT